MKNKSINLELGLLDFRYKKNEIFRIEIFKIWPLKNISGFRCFLGYFNNEHRVVLSFLFIDFYIEKNK